MANGRVITGYSKPYVATYSNTGTSVTYANGTPLARGVSVNIAPDTSDATNFYADNQLAESVNALFTSGTATITVDGLKDEARQLIMGIVTTENVTVGSDTVAFQVFDDQQQIPYMGFGCIVRYMEDGVTSYVPFILPKVAFQQEGIEANTQEDTIEFQTQELTANILKDDTQHHAWKKVGEAQATEAEAEDAIKKVLNIQ